MRTHPHRSQMAAAAALVLLAVLLAQPLSVLAANMLYNGSFEYFAAHMVNGVLQRWNNSPEFIGQNWVVNEASGAADLHFMDNQQLGQYIAPAYGLTIPNHHVEGYRAQGFGSQAAFAFVFSQTVTVQAGADYALGGKMVTYWKGPGGETDHAAMFKRIGIDPTGGRSADGATVVWTDWDGADDAWRSPALAVTALGAQATLFIQVENRSTGVVSGTLNLGYLDGFRFERAPVMTLNLPAQASPGSVAVSWNATLPDPNFWALRGYDVEVRTGAGSWQTVQSATGTGGQAQTYTLNAVAGQTYGVRVRAWQHRKPAGDPAVPALPGVWIEKQVQVSGDDGGGGDGAPGSHTVFLPLISLGQSSGSPGPDPTPDPNPTPVPSPTPPPSANTFRLKTVRMLTITENGGCAGNHNVFLSVVDPAGGAPRFGPVIGDPPANNFRVTSGDKNEPFFSYGTKTAEITLYSSGTRLKVIEDPSGTPVSSDQTPLLSTNTWEIPVDWLIGAGYCTSASDCASKPLLCQGHYSYWVVFEAQ